VVERLPSNHKALDVTPSAKKKKRGREGRRPCLIIKFNCPRGKLSDPGAFPNTRIQHYTCGRGSGRGHGPSIPLETSCDRHGNT
jgi:hypothetical protein